MTPASALVASMATGGPIVSASDTFDSLRDRVMVLNARVWENRLDWPLVERWLDNFDGSSGVSADAERLHALYVLSQFLYFGSMEIRVLLKSLYHDLTFIPLVQLVRKNNGWTRDEGIIETGLIKEFARTRFLGVGSPSESGVHLLYYFRQENRLRKAQFLDTAQLLERDPALTSSRRLRYPMITRYVFLDDICGSGSTAKIYSDNFLSEMKALDQNIEFHYHCIFGSTDGLAYIRNETVFADNVSAVFELNDSYKALSYGSRFLTGLPPHVNANIVRQIGWFYGARLLPTDPSGFNDGQLLLGFHHNTPDNTLPIIWMDPDNGAPSPWCAVFRRYPKI